MRTTSLGKIPAIGMSFWLLKVLATTLGDLTGDLLSIALHLGYRLALAASVLAMLALLVAQLRSERLRPWLFWALMLASSAVGAEVSDALARALGWGTAVTALVLLGGLVAILLSWGMCRGLPAPGFIGNRRDEVWFWAAALAGNALGSVLGDLLGDRWGLGLAASSALYAAMLAAFWALGRATRIDRRLLFWAAFVPSRIPF
jgi:uncharacterized membrane-anchored protein